MRRVSTIVLAAAAACYSPRPPAGAQCTSTDECPSPLVCAPATGTCEVSAGSGLPDAPTPGSDAAVVRPPDATLDAAAPDCWSQWETLGSGVTLATPVALAQLNTGSDDRHPWMSADGLTLYWAAGGAATANEQLKLSTRGSVEVNTWAPPVVATDLDTAGVSDSGVAITGDGHLAVFSSGRPGGTGSVDLWQAIRPPGQTAFGSADHAPLAAVDTGTIEADPDLSADGLDLLYSNQSNGNAIEEATRATVADAFGSGSAVTIAKVASSPNNPRRSPDRLVLFYGGGGRIRIATRATVTGTFTDLGPVNLGTLPAGTTDLGIAISGDGCDLVFASTRDPNAGFDLFETTVVP